ncbi:MAG: hypothetical protein PHU35_04650 [Bacteroidales bacterium]|nr:hypothetical protein [Bacteroidales bacterium]
MYKLLPFFFMLIVSTTSIFSQAFEKIPLEKKTREVSFVLKKEQFKASFGVTNESRRPKIIFNGKTNFTYHSIYQDSQLEFEIFSNPKLDFSYLVINNYLEITMGADIYLIDKNYHFVYLGHLPIGAYNRIGNEKMNYNSILPYLSIFYTKEKTYFSFEVPFLVVNPGEITEQIIESSKLHYTLIDKTLKQNLVE